MRKRKLSVLSILLSGLLTVQASANSAPIRMYGYPSSALMSIEEGSPIEVEREELSFDLSGETGRQGKVTASYEMHNTAGEEETSRMAFPYIGSLFETAEEAVVVRVDGEEVPYTIHIGEAIKGDTLKDREEAVETFDMRRVIASISTEPYEPLNFDRKAGGQTYRVRAASVSHREISLTLRFSMDEEKTRVVARGFNGYARNGDLVELTAWVGSETVLELHVQGEGILFEVEAFTSDGVRTIRTEDYTCEITVEEEAFEDYFAGLRSSAAVQGTRVHDAGLDNLYLKALDEGFESMQGVVTEEALLVADSEDRYLLLVYEVPFGAEERRSVEVSYTTEATVDRSMTTLPTYTFTYLLSPAAHWKDFRNLHIEVRTGDYAPYLIGSSVTLEAGAERVYEVDLESLPDSDFAFTLYHKPEITAKDRFEGTLRHNLGYVYFLLLPLLFLVLGAFMVLAIWGFRRRWRRDA